MHSFLCNMQNNKINFYPMVLKIKITAEFHLKEILLAPTNLIVWFKNKFSAIILPDLSTLFLNICIITEPHEDILCKWFKICLYALEFFILYLQQSNGLVTIIFIQKQETSLHLSPYLCKTYYSKFL